MKRLKEQAKELNKSMFDNLVLRLDERWKLNAEIYLLRNQIEAERQAAEDEHQAAEAERIMAASEYQHEISRHVSIEMDAKKELVMLTQ